MRISLHHMTRPTDTPPAQTLDGLAWSYTVVCFTETLSDGTEYGSSMTFSGHIQETEITPEYLTIAEQALRRYRNHNPASALDLDWSWE